MKKEMLINVLQPEECRIAIIEDGALEELYVERASQESYVNNIYQGRIVNIEPSIQAAFVDFGIGRNGFLHVSDVASAYFRGPGGDRRDDRDERGGRGRDDRGERGGRSRDDRDPGPRACEPVLIPPGRPRHRGGGGTPTQGGGARRRARRRVRSQRARRAPPSRSGSAGRKRRPTASRKRAAAKARTRPSTWAPPSGERPTTKASSSSTR